MSEDYYSLPASARLVQDDRSVVIHVIVLLDVSWSMDEPGLGSHARKIDDVIEAMKLWLRIKREHRPFDLVSLIVYHSGHSVLCKGLNVYHDHEQLLSCVEHLKHLLNGGTEMAYGLAAAQKIIKADDSGVSFRILAYSDGHDFAEGRAFKVAQALKTKGALIETIGIGKAPSNVDEPFLKSIATTDHLGTHYRFIGSSERLQQTFRQLATGMLTVD